MNANIAAGLSAFQSPGHFNDPDMLIGQPLVPQGWPAPAVCPNLEAWKTVRKRGFPPYAISPRQSRLQMALWCVMGAPLILSLNVRNLSSYDLATYANEEAIAIDQDSLALAGVRLVGGNLTTTPPVPPTPSPVPPPGTTVLKDYNVVRGQCDACTESQTGCCLNQSNPNADVQYLSHHTSRSLEACARLCRAFGQPQKRCHSFVWNSRNHDCFGRLDTTFDRNNSKYADSPGIFSGTFVARHRSPPVQQATVTTNIWGKRLSDGGFALLFLNVGVQPASLVCDEVCLRKLRIPPAGATPGRRFRVRDIWAHTDLPDVVAPIQHIAAPTLHQEEIYMLRITPALG